MEDGMKKIVLIICALFLSACSSSSALSTQDKINEIVGDKEYMIIDVRSNEEYNIEHVEGAINIPYDTINEYTELDKNKVLFVYCKSGNRSKIAYDTLTNLGYNVHDLGAISNIDLKKVS